MHQSGSGTFRTRLLPRRTTAIGAKADLANSTFSAESSAAVRGMMDLECPLSRLERTQLRSRPCRKKDVIQYSARFKSETRNPADPERRRNAVYRRSWLFARSSAIRRFMPVRMKPELHRNQPSM